MREQLLTIKEAAERCALSPATIRKWLYLRKLPSVKLGRRAVRVREGDLEALVRLGLREARR